MMLCSHFHVQNKLHTSHPVTLFHDALHNLLDEVSCELVDLDRAPCIYGALSIVSRQILFL